MQILTFDNTGENTAAGHSLFRFGFVADETPGAGEKEESANDLDEESDKQGVFQ